jgi:hypothetical protein
MDRKSETDCKSFDSNAGACFATPAITESPQSAFDLEVVDQGGEGFRTLLGSEQGMDLALRVASAVTRLRGIAMP